MSSKYRINSIQNAALAITGAVRRTSREEIRQQRRWNKILFQLLLSPNHRYFSRNLENFLQLWTKHGFFKNWLFPSTTKEWNTLDPQIRKSKYISIFKSNILKFIRLNQITSIIVIIIKELVLVITCLRGKFGINLPSSLF